MLKMLNTLCQGAGGRLCAPPAVWKTYIPKECTPMTMQRENVTKQFVTEPMVCTTCISRNLFLDFWISKLFKIKIDRSGKDQKWKNIVFFAENWHLGVSFWGSLIWGNCQWSPMPSGPTSTCIFCSKVSAAAPKCIQHLATVRAALLPLLSQPLSTPGKHRASTPFSCHVSAFLKFERSSSAVGKSPPLPP